MHHLLLQNGINEHSTGTNRSSNGGEEGALREYGRRTLIMAWNEEIMKKSALKKEARMRLFNKKQYKWNDEETAR